VQYTHLRVSLHGPSRTGARERVRKAEYQTQDAHARRTKAGQWSIKSVVVVTG